MLVHEKKRGNNTSIFQSISYSIFSQHKNNQFVPEIF